MGRMAAQPEDRHAVARLLKLWGRMHAVRDAGVTSYLLEVIAVGAANSRADGDVAGALRDAFARIFRITASPSDEQVRHKREEKQRACAARIPSDNFSTVAGGGPGGAGHQPGGGRGSMGARGAARRSIARETAVRARYRAGHAARLNDRQIVPSETSRHERPNPLNTEDSDVVERADSHLVLYIVRIACVVIPCAALPLWRCTSCVEALSTISSAARAGLPVAQREALRLVALPVVELVRLAAVARRAARYASLQPLAALACADAAAGERTHCAARPRRIAALAASMRARAGVVLLRSRLQLSDQAAVKGLVCIACRCCPVLLQRLQRTSANSGSFVSGNEV
jgi:hypothetical protein